MMENLNRTIKKMISNYHPLFKLILILKKNKLFRNTSIKKIANNTIIINAHDYHTYNYLLINIPKIKEYINQIIATKIPTLNLKIEKINIINTPYVKTIIKPKSNAILLEKIRDVKQKIYGHK